ncbi:DNA topoisomerase I, partial [Streptococcus danieliae]|nr:DNA topoisomerase I [Streptococcus danieliae]
QDASRKINFKTRKTMSVAQELYEGVNLKKLGGITGLITYMRTDSTRISEEAKKQAYAYIVDQFGEEYVATVAKKIKGNKNVQDAHEGIRPTNVNFSPNLVKDYLTPDQLKLYTLIWNRFVASQMAAAVYETRTTTFENNQIVYKASDSKIIFDGFLKVLKEKEKVKVSASFEKGDAAKYKEIKE